RFRPAAFAHHVRGQEARRRERRPDAIAIESHVAAAEDGYVRTRFRGQRGTRERSVRPILWPDQPGRGDRSERFAQGRERPEEVQLLFRGRRGSVRWGVLQT